MENKVMELLNYLFFKEVYLLAKKKGNNYVIDEANNIAKIELHRTKLENKQMALDGAMELLKAQLK